MRFRKDVVAISASRDIPLLRQVLHSVVISRTQLFTFMQLGYFESRRDAFNWRLRRLVGQDLLKVHELPALSHDPLYTITASGITCLECHGEFCPAASPISNQHLMGLNIAHTLEVN